MPPAARNASSGPSRFFPRAGNAPRIAADRPFYSGKHKKHGMNVQVLADPSGRLLWASPALPGAVHDVRAARDHGIIDALAQASKTCWADKGYRGAGGLLRIPHWGRWENLSPGQKAVNRSHAKIRALVEQAVATLKSWRLLRKLHCSTTRITSLVQAVLTLHLASFRVKMEKAQCRRWALRLVYRSTRTNGSPSTSASASHSPNGAWSQQVLASEPRPAAQPDDGECGNSRTTGYAEGREDHCGAFSARIILRRLVRAAARSASSSATRACRLWLSSLACWSRSEPFRVRSIGPTGRRQARCRTCAPARSGVMAKDGLEFT